MHFECPGAEDRLAASGFPPSRPMKLCSLQSWKGRLTQKRVSLFPPKSCRRHLKIMKTPGHDLPPLRDNHQPLSPQGIQSSFPLSHEKKGCSLFPIRRFPLPLPRTDAVPPDACWFKNNGIQTQQSPCFPFKAHSKHDGIRVGRSLNPHARRGTHYE